MWCAHCQSDVAAELPAGDRHARCASCGGELSVPTSAPPSTRTRHALQLLERWSRPELNDPYNTGNPERRSHDEPEISSAIATLDRPPRHAQPPAVESSLRPYAPSPSPLPLHAPPATEAFHLESHLPPAFETNAPPTEWTLPMAHHPSQAAPQRPAPQQAPAQRTQSRPEPHDVRAAIEHDTSTNWVALAGQLLAYAGVAVLTIGTTLALWGHFANEPASVPTGWLVASAGQMLLFLGVITLVSSGMEQAARDLNQRFDRVGNKLDRVETALDRATATSAAHYADHDRAAA
jgi:hypothetical protein